MTQRRDDLLQALSVSTWAAQPHGQNKIQRHSELQKQNTLQLVKQKKTIWLARILNEIIVLLRLDNNYECSEVSAKPCILLQV